MSHTQIPEILTLHTNSACSLTRILAQWPDAVEADVVSLQPQGSLAVSHYAMFMTVIASKCDLTVNLVHQLCAVWGIWNYQSIRILTHIRHVVIQLW